MALPLSSPAADFFGVDEFQRGAHFPIRAPPRELGGQGPQVDRVFLTEGIGADPVLLVMVQTA